LEPFAKGGSLGVSFFVFYASRPSLAEALWDLLRLFKRSPSGNNHAALIKNKKTAPDPIHSQKAKCQTGGCLSRQ
jgi:hypothetical protein